MLDHSRASRGQYTGLEDLVIEILARGLSVRDIEDAFKDEAGRLFLSKTAVFVPINLKNLPCRLRTSHVLNEPMAGARIRSVMLGMQSNERS